MSKQKNQLPHHAKHAHTEPQNTQNVTSANVNKAVAVTGGRKTNPQPRPIRSQATSDGKTAEEKEQLGSAGKSGSQWHAS